METEYPIETFLKQYEEKVIIHATKLRKLIIANLPGVIEQLDMPAKMIAYCYGQKYSELICVIIPSKKGLNLGFNRGTELADPDKLLEGNSKISRYVVVKTEELIDSDSIKNLQLNAYYIFIKKIIKKNETGLLEYK